MTLIALYNFLKGGCSETGGGAVSSPKQQVIVQEEKASKPRRFRLDNRKDFFHRKGCQPLKPAAQGSGRVTVSGDI